LEENGPLALEPLQAELKALSKKCLPAITFTIGTLLTYGILRLLPDYKTSFANLNSSIHAPSPSNEPINTESVPGEFPDTPSPKPTIATDNKDSLSAKDKEIATLRELAKQKDQELADIKAKADKQITDGQTASAEIRKQMAALQESTRQKDQELADLKAKASKQTSGGQSASAEIVNQTATNLKAKFEKELSDSQFALKEKDKLISVLQTEIDQKPDWRNGRYQTQIKDLQGQMRSLEGQVAQSQSDLARANGTLAQSAQRIAELEGQLSQWGLEAQNLLTQRGEQITALEHQVAESARLQAQLSQREVEAAKAETTMAHFAQQGRNWEQSATLADQELARVRAQLSARQADLATEKEAHAHTQFLLADASTASEAREKRLAWLEGEYEKAVQMHAQYMELKTSWAHFRALAGREGVRADCAQAELDCARAHLAGLGVASKAKRKGKEEVEEEVQVEGRERGGKRARD
jgi:hypothetical protein